jgi:hypothetical protein
MPTVRVSHDSRVRTLGLPVVLVVWAAQGSAVMGYLTRTPNVLNTRSCFHGGGRLDGAERIATS